MLPHSWLGKTIGGRYKIEALLGQGGMSAVYRATDPNLRRLVAIKMIHPHLSDDPNFVGRFKEEAAAVARLRHPNIVQVHDFNVDGETYYMVMEYLVGETLQARLKRLSASARHMPLDTALSLCLQLCEAAGYAHDHELVHRDIKPANIMLNVNGQAILMDFGIVKIIGGDYHTATGATIGTAMYMSPEQIRSERVDDRADIYSLGVTLYEMLSGHPPYTADSALTLMMMVLNDPLPDLRESRQGIPASLQTVVEKALAKDPGERFQTMAEMAAALRQVQAELATAPPAPAVTLADEAEAKPVAAATINENPQEENTTGLSQTRQPEAVAPDGRHDLLKKQVPDIATLPDSPLEAALTHTDLTASRSMRTIWPGLRRIWLPAAGLLVVAIIVVSVILYLDSRRPPALQLMPVSSSTDPVNAQTAQVVVSLGRWGTGSYIEQLAYSPDGSLLGTANNRDWVRFSAYRFYNGLWQVASGNLKGYYLGHAGWVSDIAFSADGSLLGSSSEDGSLLLWQVADGGLVRRIESSHGGLTGLAFSPDGQLLAASSWDGVVSLWQVNNGNLLRSLQADEYALKDVAFSPDGRLLAGASENNAVLLWQVSDGRLVMSLKDHTAPVYKAVFSPDGALLASTSEDRTVKIWQVSDGSLLQSLPEQSEAVYDVAFSTDGSLLASGAGDGVLRLWQVSDGTLLTTLTEYSDSIKSVTFSPDGYLLVSAAADGTIQFWGISEAIPLENQ